LAFLSFSFAATLVASGPAQANQTALARAEAAYELGDYKTASEIWLPLADIGNAEAQFQAGRMLQYGWGVEENRKRAAELFALSIAQGSGIAQYFLGEIHDEGVAGAPDPEKAQAAYVAAAALLPAEAEGGDELAQGILGSMYFEGKGVEANPEAAQRLYRAAARPSGSSTQGDAVGALVAGIMNPDSAPAALHVYDLGSNDASGKAIVRARRGAAADCGCAAAERFRTGQAAAFAGALREAHRLWLPLAEAGYADAQFALGELYRRGQGVARSTGRAREWYAAADAQGYPGAGDWLARIGG
jgi:hypothetical protein